jgi:riboflavin kinase/FMN adenylyltransferase
MTVISIKAPDDLKQIPQILVGQKVALSIGNFDGVHLGHQALLLKAKKWAKSHSGAFVLMTFSPHPSLVLNPEQPKPMIFTSEIQDLLVQKAGVDFLVKIHFNHHLKNLSAEDFFEHYLLHPFNPSFLCVGHDFAFGKDRKGTIAWLAQKTRQCKIKFEVQSAVLQQDRPVSSSRIREALTLGEMEVAKSLLGFAYFLKGDVVRGSQNGRQIGFPTLNLSLVDPLLIPDGVYVSRTKYAGQDFLSVTNIGFAPTVSRKVRMAETHLLDFSDQVYGANVEVSLFHRIRGELKFPSLDDLKKQIQKDVSLAREFFKNQ